MQSAGEEVGYREQQQQAPHVIYLIAITEQMCSIDRAERYITWHSL